MGIHTPKSESDTSLLAKLLEGNNAAFQLAYDHCFQHVASYVRKNSGNHEAAKDVFQDALTILFQKVKNGQFDQADEIGNVCAYLFRVASYLWQKQLSKNKRELISSQPVEGLDDGIEKEMNEYQRKQMVWLLLERAKGKWCKEVLIMHYYKKMNSESIANRIGYESANAVDVRKNRCLKALREQLKNNQAYRDLLDNL